MDANISKLLWLLSSIRNRTKCTKRQQNVPRLFTVPYQKNTASVSVEYRDAYAGGCMRGSYPLCPHPWGAEGARIALPSLLSSEGAFSGTSDSLLQETFTGGKPPDPQTTIQSLEDKYAKYYSSGRVYKPRSTPVEEHTYR